jgi:hypothetical protein
LIKLKLTTFQICEGAKRHERDEPMQKPRRRLNDVASNPETRVVPERAKASCR